MTGLGLVTVLGIGPLGWCFAACTSNPRSGDDAGANKVMGAGGCVFYVGDGGAQEDAGVEGGVEGGPIALCRSTIVDGVNTTLSAPCPLGLSPVPSCPLQAIGGCCTTSGGSTAGSVQVENCVYGSYTAPDLAQLEEQCVSTTPPGLGGTWATTP